MTAQVQDQTNDTDTVDKPALLRNALRGNIAFCASSGLLLLLIGGPIAE